MKNDFETEIRSIAEKFTDGVVDTVRRHVLHLVGAVVRKKPASWSDDVFKLAGSVAPKRKRKTGLAASRAAAKKVPNAAVLAAIVNAGKSGILAKDLAKAVGLVPSALAYRLGKLRAARKVRATGKTSKMRYFAAAGK